MANTNENKNTKEKKEANKTTQKKSTTKKVTSSTKVTNDVVCAEPELNNLTDQQKDTDPTIIPNAIRELNIREALQRNIDIDLKHLEEYGMSRIVEAIRRFVCDGETEIYIHVHHPKNPNPAINEKRNGDCMFVYTTIYPYSVQSVRNRIREYVEDAGLTVDLSRISLTLDVSWKCMLPNEGRNYPEPLD